MVHVLSYCLCQVFVNLLINYYVIIFVINVINYIDP